MGIRNKAKVPKEFEGIELVVCYESFTTDDEQGRPVSVAEGDLLSTDAELVRRFGSHFFCDAGPADLGSASAESRSTVTEVSPSHFCPKHGRPSNPPVPSVQAGAQAPRAHTQT